MPPAEFHDRCRHRHRRRQRSSSCRVLPIVLALSPERRPFLQAFCGLGVRDSELYRITPADLAEAATRVRVPGTKTDAAERWLQPPEELFMMLAARAEQLGDDQPICPIWPNVRRDLRAACVRAGSKPVSPNDLRRTKRLARDR